MFIIFFFMFIMFFMFFFFHPFNMLFVLKMRYKIQHFNYSFRIHIG